LVLRHRSQRGYTRRCRCRCGSGSGH
jgi:hypothetical protein